jgi:hypothetical protein
MNSTIKPFNKARFILFIIALTFSCSDVFSQKNLSNEKEKKSIGEATRPDSILPDYYLSYAIGGQFRKGQTIDINKEISYDLLIPIPTLTGFSISQSQSFDMFKRAVVFHASGKDVNESENAANSGISLPKWVRNYIVNDEKLEKLYQAQVTLGNTIVVDSEVFLPLFLNNEYSTNKQDSKIDERKALSPEIQAYYNCLYSWAAAYPWFFYKFPNAVLRQAMGEKNFPVITLFATNRFYLDQESFGALLESKIIPRIKL